jgi:hypothetical protein
LYIEKHWKKLFDLEKRTSPDFFEPEDAILGTQYASAIRTAFDDLELSAIFCVSGVPTIAFLRVENYFPESIIRIHAALWNQGLASIFAVISDDAVRVFSLAKRTPRDDVENFEDQCLIKGLDAVTKLQSLITGAETGRLWKEEKEYFKSGDRVDAVLLNNLEVSHDLLTSKGLISDQAQAILIQTTFIAYLEDRKIIRPDYFLKSNTENKSSWSDILATGRPDILYRLFDQLRRDFSGDLFVAPCSFSENTKKITLTEGHLQVLQRFREGHEKMSEEGGQLRFWGYDFHYIPVELISAVYDRFLGKDIPSRKATGAFYTPMFLVDSVVNATWDNLSDKQKEKATILDPACGSGIFLVRSFQRLCAHWQNTRSVETIRWDSLNKILMRVRGCDINSGAVRVAVFSLYLALLEQVSPPDLQRLIKKKGLLPTLWNNTLVVRDFFELPVDEARVDVLIGNPPWTGSRGTDREGTKWSKRNGYPTPQSEEA